MSVVVEDADDDDDEEDDDVDDDDDEDDVEDVEDDEHVDEDDDNDDNVDELCLSRVLSRRWPLEPRLLLLVELFEFIDAGDGTLFVGTLCFPADVVVFISI